MTHELVLSDRLVFYCGAGSCSWDQLCAVMDLEKLTAFQLPESAAGSLWLKLKRLKPMVGPRQDHENGGKMPLLDCLLYTRNQLATDPRDRIFALLGLAQAPGVVPDYTIPLNALKRDNLRHVIQHERTLDALAVCVNESSSQFELCERQHECYLDTPNEHTKELREQIVMEFSSPMTLANYDPMLTDHVESPFNALEVLLSWVPSWLPYWSLSAPRGRDILHSESEGLYYCATGNNEPEVRFEGDILAVRGIFITKIVSITRGDAGDQKDALLNQQWTIYCAYEDKQKSASSRQS